VNKELAEKVYDKITAKPELLDMSTWISDTVDDKGHIIGGNVDCHTTACIAGHAVIESAEYELVWDIITDSWKPVNAAGEVVGWHLAGEHVLDISSYTSELLFTAENHDAVALLRALINGDEEGMNEAYFEMRQL
jgi:hypothetical protein